MKNILVSREKWEALTQVAYAHHQHYIEANLPSSAKAVMGVITMPEFVESEEDVKDLEQVIVALANENARFQGAYPVEIAQAAINAMKGE